MYKTCRLCPRNCNINRYEKTSFCNNNEKIKVARAALHYYEEPCISGEDGSGTIFFSGCNLKCIYCQNKEISYENFGKIITIDRLADIMIELQNKKANNINLVTPTHFVPSIIEAIKKAREKNLRIPIVYNTSGYENYNMIKMLKDYIDIYLIDFKYFDNNIGFKYSMVNNYFESVTSTLKEIKKQISKNEFDSNGIMKKGIIVRHLILPEHIEDSKNILKYLYDNYKNSIIYSIMNQYTPINKTEYENLNRKLTQNEYNEVIEYAIDLGITNAYIQEEGTQKESFVPNFDLEGI